MAATPMGCVCCAVSRRIWPAVILRSTPWRWTSTAQLQTCLGGREDLSRRAIRCVGEPETRFREDALRLLRAYRFAAQLGFSLDAQTQAAIRRCAPLCASLSRERVREEAEKTLLSDRPEYFGRMLAEGLLGACIRAENADFSGLSAAKNAGGQMDSRKAALSRRSTRRRSACREALPFD